MLLVERMRAARKDASMSVMDMARWFDTHYSTMHQWLVVGAYPPKDYKQRSLALRLLALERAIEGGRFPIPLTVRIAERKKYLWGIRNAYPDRIPETRPAQ